MKNEIAFYSVDSLLIAIRHLVINQGTFTVTYLVDGSVLLSTSCFGYSDPAVTLENIGIDGSSFFVRI